jgi:hypothetical protein
MLTANASASLVSTRQPIILREKISIIEYALNDALRQGPCKSVTSRLQIWLGPLAFDTGLRAGFLTPGGSHSPGELFGLQCAEQYPTRFAWISTSPPRPALLQRNDQRGRLAPNWPGFVFRSRPCQLRKCERDTPGQPAELGHIAAGTACPDNARLSAPNRQ